MLVILVLIAAFFFWLSQTVGTVEIHGFGFHLIMPIYVCFIVLAVLILIIYGLMSVRHKWHLFQLKRRHQKAAQQKQKQEQLLLEGFAAVAAKDVVRAQKCLKKITEPSAPLALVLSAQTAALRRDGIEVDHAFQKMLSNPQTQFMGLRGLALQHLSRGEYRLAQELVRNSLQKHPTSPWAIDISFDIAVKIGDWEEALALLPKLSVSSEVRQHKKALIQLEMARQTESWNQDKRLQVLAKAYNADSSSLPIALAYAKSLIEMDQGKKASRVLEKVWPLSPHPEIAELYMSVTPDSLERYQRMQHLFHMTPQSWVGHLCCGEAALDASLWGAARPHIEAALQEQPIQRVYQAMIRLEDALGNVAEMRKWVARSAEEALPDPEWTCQSCGFVAEESQAVCANCREFDSFHWTRLRHRDPPVSAPQTLILPGETTP